MSIDTVKINVKTPQNGLVQLNVKEMVERDGELQIKLDDLFCYNIDAGEVIELRRIIIGQNDKRVEYNSYLTVIREDENHVIYTTLPEARPIRLNVSGKSESFYDGSNLYHIIHCRDKHYLYGQDLQLISIINQFDSRQEVYFKNSNGETLSTCYGISAMNMDTLKRETVADCFIDEIKVDTCSKPYKYITYKYYSFLPEVLDQYSFILSDYDETMEDEYSYIEFKFNPFYYYIIYLDSNNEPYEFDNEGNPVKHCVFYGDLWWDSQLNSGFVKYINTSTMINNAFFNMRYYSVSTGLSSDCNASGLGAEDFFSEQFAENIEEMSVPEFIDMERLKYVPYAYENDRYKIVNKINIYPHFRQRVLIKDVETAVVPSVTVANAQSTKENVYVDGWYIDPDEEGDKYWNGFEHQVGGDLMQEISQFIQSEGNTADLIGFLNFTDKDVYYQKHKVSKSFYRFSFYDSIDPIEQKLLYYSTVFVDSTDLFGKYIRQQTFINENSNDVLINGSAYNANGSLNKNVETVFCENTDVNSRLDTQLTITDEYDKDRSAEGFNLYLFANDAVENEDRTIYLKIEFNHAGVGKTIPMVALPQDQYLTKDNYFEYLYIPIKIKKYNGKYIYMIEKAVYNNTDNSLNLCIFEPKLEDNGSD